MPSHECSHILNLVLSNDLKITDLFADAVHISDHFPVMFCLDTAKI